MRSARDEHIIKRVILTGECHTATEISRQASNLGLPPVADLTVRLCIGPKHRILFSFGNGWHSPQGDAFFMATHGHGGGAWCGFSATRGRCAALRWLERPPAHPISCSTFLSCVCFSLRSTRVAVSLQPDGAAGRARPIPGHDPLRWME